MQTLPLAALMALGLQTGPIGTKPLPITIAPAAQIDESASPAKLQLIRQFLKLIGLQGRLDTGSFLERYAMPGGPMWAVKPGENVAENLTDGFKVRFDALKAAYAKRRAMYQQAYEDHLNWEFTEAELTEIIAFLGKPVGKHYLDGRWRMEAYTSTNTEGIEQEIVEEALASFTK